MTTVRTLGNPKDDNTHIRRKRPPDNDDDAPTLFKVGTNATLTLASASNGSEYFGGGDVGPKISGTRKGRKYC